MTALMTPPLAARVPPSPPVVARPYRWTNDDFRQLTDLGMFADQFVILIDGEFIHMPNPSAAHDMGVGLCDYRLKGVFGPSHWVRIQSGFATSLNTNPVPDVAVVVGSPRDYPTHPRQAALIVEVADSTLAYDRGEKSNLYAAAGVPEYWVLDVNGRQLLVFRDPVADAAAPRGFRYATTLTLTDADAVSPLAVPAASVRVAELLP